MKQTKSKITINQCLLMCKEMEKYQNKNTRKNKKKKQSKEQHKRCSYLFQVSKEIEKVKDKSIKVISRS